MELEEKFDIQIPDDQAEKIKTVRRGHRLYRGEEQAKK